MQYVDLIIISIIVLSFAIGIYRGLVKEILSLSLLVAAIVGAFYSSEYLLSFVSEYIVDTQLPYLSELGISLEMIMFSILFIILFITILVLGNIIILALSSAVNESPLNFFNRLLGSVFGIARGGVIVIMLIIFLAILQFPMQSELRKSKILPYFIDGAQYAVSYFPYHYLRNLRFDYSDSTIDGKQIPIDKTPTLEEGQQI